MDWCSEMTEAWSLLPSARLDSGAYRLGSSLSLITARLHPWKNSFHPRN
jgi:hypothetical protein